MTGSSHSSARRWYVLTLLGVAFFMTILDGTSLLTALPAIEHDFRQHGPAIQWTVTAYALAFSGLVLLCGRAADLLGRRRVFLVGMAWRVLASLGCGLAPAVLRESRDRQRSRSFDTAGALTINPALILLVYVITRVPSAGWASGQTIGLLASVAVLVWLFILIEKRSVAPLVPFRVLRSRMLIGGNLLLLVAGMAVDGMLITLTSHVQQVLGWSAARFGLMAAVMTVTAVAGALVSQRVATRLGVARVAAAGAVLLGCGCLLLTRMSADGSPGLLPAALFAFGAGMGAVTVCSQIAALTGVTEKDSGLAAGLADTSFAIGTALGVAICTSVAARASAVGEPAPFALTAGRQAAFEAAGVFAALVLVIALTLLGKRPGRARTEPADALVGGIRS
jgi:MFS family permease